MAKLNDLLQEVRNELGADFVASDVVGMDGLSIAGVSAIPDFDADVASARFAMVMKLASKVSERLAMGDVDEDLVTTDQVFVLARFLGDSSFYWVLAVTKEATLGVVRMLMNEYEGQIWDAVPR
jgi:predicted regulator of Ras-like GTPase activity (Roadblock/LC7/MglB family)